MTLLQDIQNAAIDAKSDLGEVLRKCKVLAAGLGSKPLEDWLIWECNGYPPDTPLPDYRIWSVELRGNFVGYGGSEMRNMPIPASCVPDKFREAATMFKCRDSVATIEHFFGGAYEDGNFVKQMPELSVVLGERVLEDMTCIYAWGEYSRGHLVKVLNTVRNRILDFVIAIGKECPEAGSAGANRNPVESGKVTQIFNTLVYGGSANVAGATSGSTVTFNVQVNNIETLKEALRQAGIEETDIDALVKAVKAEPKPRDAKSFGPHVAGWISRMAGKAATGAWQVGVGAAGQILATAIGKFYGLQP